MILLKSWTLGQLMAGKYQRTIEHVFKQRVKELEDQVSGSVYDEEIPFHRNDIEQALEELDIDVKNVPDIPYAYRSRRELPESVSKHGYNAVVLDDSRPGEDPTYLFTKRKQLIKVPEEVERTKEINSERIPEPVRKHLRKDEQGVLTKIRYTGILDDFTGLDCYHIGSHIRFRVKGREAELDDLYVGVDENGDTHALAVEAKGKGETLNRNQLIRNTRGIENKDQYPANVHTIAVKLTSDESIYIFEFDLFQEAGEDNIRTEKVWRYS